MATLPESGTKRPKLTTPDKRRFCHGATCPTINTLAILRYLYGSKMVLLGVVIGKCETPTTNISQENGHGMLMIEFQFVPYKHRNNRYRMRTRSRIMSPLFSQVLF